MDRGKNIIKVSIVGIIVNCLLVVAKAIIGFITGSVAVMMDAVNNLSDALSSVITIIGTVLAGKAPDKKHPYGYGRIEHLSSITIAILVLFAAFAAFKESLDKLLHPALADYTNVTVIMIAAFAVVKLLLGLYVKGAGKKYKSESLVASGADALFDAIISLSTFVAALISMFWSFSVEGFLGIVISVLICKAGIEILLESLSGIIGDRVEADFSKQLKKHIASFEGVNGAYDLALHKYGPQKIIGSVHIEVPDDLSVRDIHHLTRVIMDDVAKKFGVFLTVGIYAANTTDPRVEEMKQVLAKEVKRNKDILGFHAFYLDEEIKLISFDLVMSFKCEDRFAVRDMIVGHMEKHYSGYNYVVNLDVDVSD